MERLVIQGGAPIAGTIPVRGAKNHVLKLIPAAFLVEGTATITNVPRVSDVDHILEIVEQTGATVEWLGEREVAITPPAQGEMDTVLSPELAPKLRASVVFMGPILARYGEVTLPYPGGDKIGKRPIDFFINGLEQLGAVAEKQGESVHITAPNGLHGAEIIFPRVSVTGTESLLMAACLAEGTTVLHNAALEPEVTATAEWLKSQGAQIEGIGTPTITITGGALLSSGSVAVVPDRIEAGSFLYLAAAAGAELTVTDCEPEHLTIPLHMMRQMGVEMTVGKSGITIHKRTGELKPLEVVTHEYPGFSTDLQPPMTVLLTMATGFSEVRETIFDSRLLYTDLLNSMNAKIELLDPFRIRIEGPTQYKGTTVESLDIRAGIALLIAGAIAEGETIIHNIHHIDRGYERIEERLQQIGVQIERITD